MFSSGLSLGFMNSSFWFKNLKDKFFLKIKGL